jgi:hypothetical protein
VFRCVCGMKCWRTIFHAQLGPLWISQKACQDMLRGTCVFTSSAIYGSNSAFWFIRGAKRQRTIFNAQVSL